MKIYKYGKMTYPIRECPNCGCVFSFNKAFVHYGETNAEGIISCGVLIVLTSLG